MAEEKDNHPQYAAINVKLAEIAAASSTLPSWYQDWSRLRPQSPDTNGSPSIGPSATLVLCPRMLASSWLPGCWT